MMVTEEQAGALWCPMARSGEFENFPTSNRDRRGEPELGTYCIASRCMMWKFDAFPFKPKTSETFVLGWTYVSPDEAPQHNKTGEFWLEPDADYLKRRLGQCGLSRR